MIDKIKNERTQMSFSILLTSGQVLFNDDASKIQSALIVDEEEKMNTRLFHPPALKCEDKYRC